MISCWIAKATTLNEQKSNDYDKGTLKMIDIQSLNASLKMKWVQIYLNTEDKGKWKVFFYYYSERYGGILLFKCTLKQKDASQLKKKTLFKKKL